MSQQEPNAHAPTVAVIGASSDPTKYSHRSLKAHQRCGYEVYPINPRGGEILGVQVYPSIDETPVSRFDRITVYVPPQVTLLLLDAFAHKGCDELWLNPGAESPAVVARAEELGLPVIQACSLVDCLERSSDQEGSA